MTVSYTHLDVYKRQAFQRVQRVQIFCGRKANRRLPERAQPRRCLLYTSFLVIAAQDSARPRFAHFPVPQRQLSAHIGTPKPGGAVLR